MQQACVGASQRGGKAEPALSSCPGLRAGQWGALSPAHPWAQRDRAEKRRESTEKRGERSDVQPSSGTSPSSKLQVFPNLLAVSDPTQPAALFSRLTMPGTPSQPICWFCHALPGCPPPQGCHPCPGTATGTPRAAPSPGTRTDPGSCSALGGIRIAAPQGAPHPVLPHAPKPPYLL